MRSMPITSFPTPPEKAAAGPLSSAPPTLRRNGKLCADDTSCTAPAKAADIQNYVKTIIPQGVDATKVTITPTWPVKADSPLICSAKVGGLGPFDNYPGCTVQVQVQYTFKLIFPLVVTGPLTFTSSSDMVIVH